MIKYASDGLKSLTCLHFPRKWGAKREKYMV